MRCATAVPAPVYRHVSHHVLQQWHVWALPSYWLQQSLLSSQTGHARAVGAFAAGLAAGRGLGLGLETFAGDFVAGLEAGTDAAPACWGAGLGEEVTGAAGLVVGAGLGMGDAVGLVSAGCWLLQAPQGPDA